MMTCARCGGDGHTAPHCPWPADERDLDRGQPVRGPELGRGNSLGPSTARLDTGRNDREIGPVDGLGNS